MKNLSSALCVMTGIVLIVLFGFNLWSLGLLAFGILLIVYLPEKDRNLYVRSLELNNQKLELEIELLKKRVKL